MNQRSRFPQEIKEWHLCLQFLIDNPHIFVLNSATVVTHATLTKPNYYKNNP